MNAPVKRATTLLPHELPETFAMDCEGTCLEPKVRDGTKLLFSRDAAYVPGDLVCLFIRPEFVRPGEHQFLVKKLVFAPARGYWRNPASYEGSDIKPTVIVDMLNPLRRIYIKPEALYGIYKCLGPVPNTMRAVHVSDEELKFKAAASMGEHTITRRTALAMTGSGLTAALAGLAVTASAQPAGVQTMIEVHRAAIAVADALWLTASEISDANPAVGFAVPKVQYSRLLLGRNDDGSDQFEPLFAYTEETIDKVVDRDLQADISIWGSGPGDAEKRRAAIHEKAEARRERLKGELRRQKAELQAAEDACGLTAAAEAATAASRQSRSLLADLLAYQCRDISEVTALATYLAECEAEDIVDAETLVEWVRALAGKAVSI